jgi:hypothetical protein
MTSCSDQELCRHVARAGRIRTATCYFANIKRRHHMGDLAVTGLTIEEWTGLKWLFIFEPSAVFGQLNVA